MKLSGTNVWVTGASSGIGAALVPELVSRGAKVIATARRREKLDALVAAHGAENVAVVEADLAMAESIPDAAARAEAAFGHVDVLINNAGRSQRASVEDTSMDDVRALMELNFMAPVALSKAVLPGMRARGKGHVSIVSSVAGYVSTPHRSTYCATKFAVRGFFDCLRAELHGSGVEVSVICPGYVNTEITEHAVAAGGASHGKTSDAIATGLSAGRAAEIIASGIEKGRPEVHLGGKEVAGIHIARHLPSLMRRIAPRVVPD